MPSRLLLDTVAETDLNSATSRRTRVEKVFADKFVLTAEANRQLHDTWIGCGAGNAAERGGAEAAIGLSEGGRVGHVEQFGAKFHPCLSKKRGVLDKRQIEISIGWAADGVA